MVRQNGRKKLIIAGAILGVLLVAIGTVAAIKALNPSNNDPYVKQTASGSVPSEDNASGDASTGGASESSGTSNSTQKPTETPAVDPATVTTIDVAPMSLSVSYVKGVGAFEYQVLRTPSGTQYVEFKSAELVGTKCTDDEGAFASIIQNPSSSETNSTVSQTVDLDATKYGLALSGTNCTSNVELLGQYQQSFSKAFSLLKKTN